MENFQSEGFACAGERHVGDKGNFSFSEVSGDTIAAMVRSVAKEKPQAITIFCTNMAGAPLVEALERETGIPIYDTVATALWDSLRLAGGNPARVQGWGRLFREVP
jgi:maleate isomerase